MTALIHIPAIANWLALAGFLLVLAAGLCVHLYAKAGEYVAAHVEAALGPDPFFAHVDDLRSDFDPDPTDVPLLDLIAANELRGFFSSWDALAKEETS